MCRIRRFQYSEAPETNALNRPAGLYNHYHAQLQAAPSGQARAWIAPREQWMEPRARPVFPKPRSLPATRSEHFLVLSLEPLFQLLIEKLRRHSEDFPPRGAAEEIMGLVGEADELEILVVFAQFANEFA